MLTSIAKRRINIRNLLVSSALTGMCLPVMGQNLQFIDPFILSGLPEYKGYVFADIDNDGDQDAFHGSGFYENQGGDSELPKFELKSDAENPIGGIPFDSPTFVDIDGDGDLDVFIGALKEEHVRLYENTGSASAAQFVIKDTSTLGALHNNSTATRLSFVDIDGDQDQDVFFNGGFLENTGTVGNPFFVETTFGDDTSLLNNLLAATDNQEVPIFLDWDGDNDQDAIFPETKIVNGQNFTDMVFLENTGSTKILHHVASTRLFGSQSMWQAQDLNQDSKIDLSVNGIPFFNKDHSEIQEAFEFARLKIPLEMSFAYMDADNVFSDPFIDAYALMIDDNDAGTYKYKIQKYANEGGMGYSTIPTFWGELWSAPLLNTQLNDVDLDGDLDQISHFGSDNDLYFLENIGTTKSPDLVNHHADSSGPFETLTLNNGKSPIPVFVDIDDDNDMDFFTLEETADTSDSDFNHHVVFFENTGTAENANYVKESTASPMFSENDIYSFAFSDIDLDGDKDLLMATTVEFKFYENTGNSQIPNFVLSSLTNSPFKNVSPPILDEIKFADIDSDSFDDLIVGDSLYLAKITTTDSDNDGMLDAWESQYGLSPYNADDALLDSDHDGYSNLAEFLAVTTPNDDVDFPDANVDPCQNTGASVIAINNKLYGSSENITCSATNHINIGLNVGFSSGTTGSFSAPLIHLTPSVSVPLGSSVTFTSQN